MDLAGFALLSNSAEPACWTELGSAIAIAFVASLASGMFLYRVGPSMIAKPVLLVLVCTISLGTFAYVFSEVGGARSVCRFLPYPFHLACADDPIFEALRSGDSLRRLFSMASEKLLWK
jgi:hypothetical protein